MGKGAKSRKRRGNFDSDTNFWERVKEQKEEATLRPCDRFMEKGVKSRKRRCNFVSATNLWEKG
jgi:hypothetical protein